MATDWTTLWASRTRNIRASAIRELLKLTARPEVISFAGGLPATETLPIQAITEACARILSTCPEKALQYGPTEGHLPLREQIAARYLENCVPVTPDNLVITTGSQQGLDLVGRTLIDHGDLIVTEAPTYVGALQAWRPCSPVFIDLPVDHDGMPVERIDLGLPIQFVYVLPNFQNPSGVSLSLERRHQLVEMAHRHRFIIVEDDPYRALRYSGEDLPALVEIEAQMLGPKWDTHGRVIHLGTLSKVMAPGLRIGWILAPSTAVRMFVLAKQGADLHSSTLTQFIAEVLMRDGTMEANYPFLLKVYRERRDTMLEALHEDLSDHADWTHPEGGLFIWLTAPGLHTQQLFTKAVERNVAFVPGTNFYPNGGGDDTMRLNFSCMPPERIREGVERLAHIIIQAQAEVSVKSS